MSAFVETCSAEKPAKVRPGLKPGKVFTLLTFFLIPFLGGNNLALFYVNIDRFWIESLFTLLLILSITSVYLEGKGDRSGFLQFLVFFLPFPAMNVISLYYSWNRFGGMLYVEVLIWAAGGAYLFLMYPAKKTCLAGLVAGAAGCAISQIIQHEVLFPGLAHVFQEGVYAQILKEQSGIPFSSYSYHNILGGYLAFVLPLAIYFAAYGKGVVRTVISSAACALIITGVILSSTRIGLGIVFICIMVSFAGLALKREWRGMVSLCIALVLALGVTLAVFHGAGAKEGSAVQGVITHKTKTVYKDLSTLNTRTDIWKNAVNAFKAKPLVGFGSGAFEYAYRKYFDGGSYTVVAHSTVVKIAVELGIAGLLCFLFYLAGVLLGAGRTKWGPFESLLFLSVLSGFLFGVVDFSFDVASHVITFFVLTSFFLVQISPDNSQSSNARREPHELVSFALVLICLLVAFAFNSRVGMERKDVENGDLFREAGLPAAALSLYRNAMTTMPFSSEPYVKATATLMELAGSRKDEKGTSAMVDELRQYLNAMARKNDRNSERYLTMGQGYAFVGDEARSNFYFNEALSYYPSSPYYTYEIACYYLAAGKYDLAISCIRGFDRYIPKFRTPHNPRGIFIYKIRDLEASLEYAKGNRARAVDIARKNLKDARDGIYVITSFKSRNYISRESLLSYLQDKVGFYEKDEQITHKLW